MNEITHEQIHEAIEKTFPDGEILPMEAIYIVPVLKTEPEMLKSRLVTDLGWTQDQAKRFLITLLGMTLIGGAA